MVKRVGMLLVLRKMTKGGKGRKHEKDSHGKRRPD